MFKVRHLTKIYVGQLIRFGLVFITKWKHQGREYQYILTQWLACFMVEIIKEHLVRILSKFISVIFVHKSSWNKNYCVRDSHFTDESAVFSFHSVGFVTWITMQQPRRNKLEFSVMIARVFLPFWWSVYIDGNNKGSLHYFVHMYTCIMSS